MCNVIQKISLIAMKIQLWPTCIIQYALRMVDSERLWRQSIDRASNQTVLACLQMFVE